MNEVLFGEGNVHPLLSFSVFMLSQWGWWCFLGKHSHADPLFLPSLTACFQITTLVFLGMVGQILLGTYLLFAFGAAYLLYAFIKKQRPLQSLSAVGTLYLLCMMVVLYLITKKLVLFSHDDFSHWATVVKDLVKTNSFPDKSRYITEHFKYPLGSAVWIYFFSKLTCTNSEPAWMIGQALLMLYCILPLFYFLPKKSCGIYTALYFLFVVFLTNCFMAYNIRVYCLMVDTLFPLVGAAASIFAFYSDNELLSSPESQNIRFLRSIWFLTPYLCALIQIKTPGVFLVIAAVVILLLKSSVHTNKYRLIQTGIVFVASFVPLILWRMYCSVHFSGMKAKHDGSFSSFLSVLSQKTAEDISTISFRAIKYFLTSQYIIEFVLVLLATFLIASLISKDDHFYQSAIAWEFLLIAYVLYAVSTVGMFLFSMPKNEALKLSTIDRYQKTILVYCYYIVFCTMLYCFSDIDFIIVRRDKLTANTGKVKTFTSLYGDSQDNTSPYTIVRVNDQTLEEPKVHVSHILTLLCVFFLLFTGWCYKYNGHFQLMTDNYGGGYMKPRLKFEAALESADIPQGVKWIVLRPDNTDLDNRALLVFFFGADRSDIMLMSVNSSDQLQTVDDALLEDTWVLVADNENELIQEWLLQKEDSHIVFME